MDGMLSQEEINALLSGMSDDDTSDTSDTVAASQSSDGEFLTEIEKDTIGEISNISMGTAATTLSSLVNQKVNISTPVVTFSKWDDLVKSYDRPCVFLQISYREGLDGKNILILRENDVKIIADLMMGGDGTSTDGELGELHLSAICEAMNQMMGSASTSLSSMLNMKIDISPPIASLIDLNGAIDEDDISSFLKEGFVRNSFKMTIGDLVDSEIMQLFPVEFAKNLCDRFMVPEEAPVEEKPKETPKEEPKEAPPVTPQPIPQEAPQTPPPHPMNMNESYGQPMMNGYPPYPPNGYPPMGYPQMPYGQPMQPMQPMQPAPEINVQPASFQQFTGDLASVTQKENINLIMDVPLEVTVELGRTTKSIQDILEFAPGTIIELDKIAGEPIDVLVNGKFVAKGEVVVIEESFGVRVTEIIK